MNKSIILVLLLLTMWGCKSPAGNEIPTQGVKGTLLWVEGNQMPGPGAKIDKRLPVKREVYICKSLTGKDLDGNPPLFKKLPESKVVQVVSSDASGIFMATLPEGEYSIFTKEEEGFFANRMNGQGTLNPISVAKNKLTEIEIVINYKAVY